MKNLRRGVLRIAGLIFFLALTGLSRAQGRQVIFSVTGDVPYSSSEAKTFKKQVDNHNKFSPSAFFVHVGDIMSGGATCNESAYSSVAGIMKGLAVPAYIVPGDNETIDCKSAASGMNLFLKHFGNLEQSSCSAPSTERQTGRPENWAFTLDGVLFAGLDLVYNEKNVQKQAAEWAQQQLSAKGSQIRAAVFFAHFDPNASSTFSKPFRAAAKAFGKPVLFAHGHGHSWSLSSPFPEKNILRVQVNMGAKEDPVQVTVTTDVSSTAKAFLLKRNAFGKTTVTMPPCVNAGPDQTNAAALTMLQGSVGTSTGAFTTTWSQVSGPGAVLFGDANALTTTASFSVAGTYLVRLTAESGALQRVDDVTINVNGGGTSTFSLTTNTTGSGQVNFNPAGGIYNAGTVVTLTAIPQSGTTGFQFSGWSGDLSGSVNPATMTMDGNKTVTATFTALPVQYSLTVNKSGSGNVTLNPSSSSGVYNAGTAVTLTTTPVAGFQFSGWSGDLSGLSNPTTITMNGNKTVTATFTSLPQYNLTVNKAGSGTVTLSPPGASGVYTSGTVVTLIANAATGFHFSGWSGDLSASNNPMTITMNGNKTVTAAFTALPPVQYNLTVNKVGSGNVAINPFNASGVYDKNTVVTLSATPASGFQFSSWSGDLSGSATSATITMGGNKTVTATFTPVSTPQFNLTLNKSGSGNVALDPAGGVYDQNTVVKLTATPATGFQFNGWNGDLSGSTNPATLTMNAHKTVTATFAPLAGVVVYEQTRIGGASNSTTVTTLGSLTAANGNLYLAAISMRPKTAVLSVSGLGLNWKLVKSKCAGRNTTAIEVWMAQGPPTGNGAITATFASAPSTAVIAVSRYSNVATTNPIGNILAGNTTGMNTSGVCSGGVDKNSYSFNLTTTKNGAAVYAVIAIKEITHTPGAGYIGRAAVQQPGGANTSGVVTEDKIVMLPATISVNGALSGVDDWAVVALEIKPVANSSFAKQNASTAAALPSEFALQQNYPNPFSLSGISDNPSTKINFSLPQAAHVNIKVYTINGEEVATLTDAAYAAGAHAVFFTPKNLPSGTYLYVLQAGDVRLVRRLVLLK